MSKFEELIQKYCPDGVEFKTLIELGDFYGGLTGKTKDDFKDGNAKFITYMNVFKNPALDLNSTETVKIGPDEKQRKIEYGDVIFTGSSETADECAISSVVTENPREDYYLNSFCFIWRLKDKSKFDLEFLKHLLRSDSVRKQLISTASGVTRFNVSKKKMETVEIPVPPLAVQREIAKELDCFTRLTTELTTELTARTQQYEYYRDKLLTFDEGKVEIVKLADIADIGTGSSNTNEGLPEGKYPFYVRSPEPLRKNEYEFDETAIITAGDGVGVGKVFHFVEGKYALHQRAYRIHINTPKVMPRFFFHYMQCKFLPYIESNMFQGSVASIRRPMLNEFPVPVPEIRVQERIINVLDNFDKICTDLKIGLPAEIEARQQQYEFYREKLLTFDDAGNTLLSKQQAASSKQQAASSKQQAASSKQQAASSKQA